MAIKESHIENTGSVIFDRLFTASQTASPVYQQRLANHLPMALIAMNRLGASDSQLLRFYEDYKDKLECLDERFDYQHYLNKFELYGIAPVLHEALDQYAEDICASAFHALIRIGYAVLIDQPTEIAIGLSYLAAEKQSLGQCESDTPSENRNATLSLQALFKMVQETPALYRQSISAPNIIVRLDKVASIPEFSLVIDACKKVGTSLVELTKYTLAIYEASGDFTALHGVTSCHALRHILDYFNRDQYLETSKTAALHRKLIRYYTLSIIAAYISIGTPEFNFPESPSSKPTKESSHSRMNWQSLIDQALSGGDDHDIKFVYTCREQYQVFHDPQFYLCAEKRITESLLEREKHHA